MVFFRDAIIGLQWDQSISVELNLQDISLLLEGISMTGSCVRDTRRSSDNGRPLRGWVDWRLDAWRILKCYFVVTDSLWFVHTK